MIPSILKGLGVTIELTLMSGVFGIILGMLSSLARVSRNQVINKISLLYVTLFRGTPLLLQIMFLYYASPLFIQSLTQAMGRPELADVLRPGPMTSGVIALSLNAGAYITEIFRAAIQSIDKGQMEAARSLGMSYGLAMRRVILPQTFRRLIPPIVNELAALSKDTSLVSVIALGETLYNAQRISAKYLRPWEALGWAAVGYLAIVLALTALATKLEKKLEARE